MKYFFLKFEDPIPSKDGTFSDGPADSSSNIATYREKAPHLSFGKKVHLIKNVFVSEKKISFPETTRQFKYEWLLLFPSFVILPVRMHLTASVLFGRDFPTKTSWLKVYFHSPSALGQVLFLTLQLIVKERRRKLILHMNLFKVFIFQHGLNLKVFFPISEAQVMK